MQMKILQHPIDSTNYTAYASGGTAELQGGSDPITIRKICTGRRFK